MKDNFVYNPKRKRQTNGVYKKVEDTCTASTGEISNILQNTIYWRSFPRVQTDEEVFERIGAFFEHCQDTGEIPTVEKMCMSLGVTRTAVTRWRNGSQGNVRAEILNLAYDAMAAIDAELVLNRKIPDVPYIFRAKNFYGMSDRNEVVIAPKNPLESEISSDELRQKYERNAPDIEVDDFEEPGEPNENEPNEPNTDK